MRYNCHQALDLINQGKTLEDNENGYYHLNNGEIKLNYYDDVQPPIYGNTWTFKDTNDFLTSSSKSLFRIVESKLNL